MKRTILALALLTLTLPAFGQGVDSILGTWKLNLEKTTSTEPLVKNLTNIAVRRSNEMDDEHTRKLHL
jgi:hypothetical protein